VGGGLEIQGSTYAVSATADKSGFRVQDNQSATILFIGNLVPIKGPDVLLRAFAEIIRGTKDPGKKKIFEQKDAKHAKGECVHSAEGGEESSSLRPLRSSVQNPHLLIIGGGPLRGKLERMAKELGIADRVHFLGNRPHGEVALWMNAADVLCLTSRSEGMPNVVAEALASGLPVVATDVGACREMLEGEPAARVCRSEDVEGLAGAVAEVLAMEVDRKAMAEKYAGKYSWRKTAERIVGMMDIRR
jgi:glycosyltransferase involved in cell wall biosynthesis